MKFPRGVLLGILGKGVRQEFLQILSLFQDQKMSLYGAKILGAVSPDNLYHDGPLLHESGYF